MKYDHLVHGRQGCIFINGFQCNTFICQFCSDEFNNGKIQISILLDSQLKVNSFLNADLLKNILHETDSNRIKCHFNGGIQIMTQLGTLLGYGEVWHNPNSLANILSLVDMTRKYKVTFGSSKEQAFNVH